MRKRGSSVSRRVRQLRCYAAVAMFAMVLLPAIAAHTAGALSPGGFTATRGSVSGSGGDGSSANPFQSLYDAYQTVTTAGTYHFSVQGQQFSSHVVPGGWTLVVSGKASTTESRYAASFNLTLQSDATLTKAALQALDIESLRINASAGAAIDVTTSAAAQVARVKGFQNLNNTTTSHLDWSGVDADKMRATCVPPTRELNLTIWQSCGVGTNLHWMPVNNAEGFANNQDTADMNLWVRNTKVPVPSPASLLWLRADDGLNCTVNDCAVTSWQDRSGSRNATNVGTVTRTNNSINFNPAVHFDASEYVTGSSLVRDGTYTDANLYMVTRTTSNPANDHGFLEILDMNNMSLRLGVHSPWSDGRYYWDAGSYAGNSRLFTSTGLAARGTYQLQSYNASTLSGQTFGGVRQAISFNGKVAASDNTQSLYTGGNNPYSVGGSAVMASQDSNDVAEVIATTGVVTAQDRQRIESYLAVKYGLTLDQTSEYDYTDSTGAVVWDSSDHTGYKNNIVGIGRDDESGLNQKVSTSYSAGAIASVALSNNFTAANDDPVRTAGHANNRQFFMLSSSAGATTPGVNELPAGYTSRVAREWAVDKTTSFTQNPSLKFTGFGSDWSLMKDSDGNFASGAVRVGELDSNGQISNVNVADGEYLTLAKLNPAGATVTPVDTLTSEDGDTGSFSIVLTRPPTSDVTIALSSSNTSEGTVQSSVTFTPANWNQPQSITVTGIDDNPPVGDGSISYQIITGDVTSSDSAYDALDGSTISDVTMQNQNNDPPGVVVNVIGFTNEDGGTATVEFRLLSQPVNGASVTIPLSISDTTEGSIAVSSITITNANWNNPSANRVIVTGVDDDIADGEVFYNLITGDPTSAGPGYDGLGADDVVNPQIANRDNDVAGTIVVQSGGSTDVTEGGPTDSYTVRLATQPTDDVDMTLLTTPNSQITLTPNTHHFTPQNWNIPQTITVAAIDDDVAQGPRTVTINRTISSNDSTYAALTSPGLTVQVSDNDTAGYSITPTNGSTEVSETGTTDTFALRLTSRPTSNVVFTVSSSDTSEATVDTSTVIFAPDEWNQSKSVTVTGVDDFVADGTQTYSIAVAVDDASSAAEYRSLADQSLAGTTTDNDSAGIVLTPGSQTIAEQANGSLDVQLSSQPTSNVVVALSSGDTSAVTLAPTTLTFTPANWNTAQTVTATAVDDADVLPETVTITASIVDSSSAAEYGAVNDQTATVTTTDNDTAGVVLSKNTLTLGENGGTDSLTAVLSAQPSSDVVVTVNSANAGEATVAPSKLTFTPANWNTPQTVTVTGVDDQVDRDDTTSLTVTIDDAASANEFDSVADQTIAVTLTDDDTAGLTLTPTSLTIDENGDSDVATVQLTAQPTSNVVIAVSSSDNSAAVAGPSTIVFTPANWNLPQAVMVTGQPDSDARNENVTVTLSIDDANSADEYDTVADRTVSVTVNDLDAPGIVVTPQALTMSENGGKDNFSVRLSARPAGNVEVTLTPSATGEATISQTQLTFTPSNWNTPQVVDVTGIDDTIHATGSATTLDLAVEVHAAASSDEYDNVPARQVTITLTDDDGPLDDADGDGITNADESLAPSGDGNGDGIADSRQTEVATRPNPVTGSYTTLVTSGPCSLAPGAFDITAETANATQDQAYDYPLGLNHFTLNCANPGDNASLTFYYDKVYQTSDWDWRKYADAQSNEYFDMNTFVGYNQATVNGAPVTTASLTIQDGSRYDQDGQRNGAITDPSGPAVLVDANAPGAPNTGFERVRGGIGVLSITVGIVLLGLVVMRARQIRTK